MSSRRPGPRRPRPSGSSRASGKQRPSAASSARRRVEASKVPPKPTSKTNRPASSPKKSRPESRNLENAARRRNSSERFGSKWNLVIKGKEKTHQISLRLAAVLAFAAVAIFIVATPLNQYLAQQQEKRTVLANLEEMEVRVAELERELELWKDESYIQSQARERLGYVMPGQTLYSVTDPDAGTASEQLAQRAEEVNRLRRESTPYYVTMWDSISVAGQVGDFENPSEVPVIDAPATPGSTEGDEADETPAAPEDTNDAEPADDVEPAVPAASVQDTGETSDE